MAPGGTMRTYRVPAAAYTAAPATSTARGTIPVPAPGKHQLRFAIFHGGNPGHLWRGELFSLLGDAVVAAGVVMWLALLSASPRDVAVALFALGLPALLAGPLATPFTRLQEPVRLFNLFGRLRVLFALALIGMHYSTILPVLYLLLFGLSLCGRLRSALRVAAARTCLAPGEPERVAASTHFAAVVVAVAGPLLAALLFILNGERILLVAGGAVAAYLLGAAADAQLDPLPRTRRAFLLARPEEEDDPPDLEAEDDADPDEDPDEALHRREAALPEWQQWGPGSLRQAWRDVRDGMGLASSGSLSAVGLRALAALALVGGGLGVFEVFYLTDHLLLPTFYLGPLLAAEGAGLALGATIWSDLGRRGAGRVALVFGTAASGVALVALADAPSLLQALLAAVLLGGTNAVAVEGGRQALRAGFDGLQRRALAATESLVTCLCALAGIPLFVLFHYGYALPASGGAAGSQVVIVPYSAPALFFAGGVGLVLVAVALVPMLVLGGAGDRRRARRARRRSARRGGRRSRDGWEESGAYAEESGLYAAADGYDEDEDLDDWAEDEEYPDSGRGGWDDDRDDRPPRGRGGRARR
jgi:hypothetical protein